MHGGRPFPQTNGRTHRLGGEAPPGREYALRPPHALPFRMASSRHAQDLSPRVILIAAGLDDDRSDGGGSQHCLDLRLYRAAWACRVNRPWRKASDRRQGREVRYATTDTISSSVKFATTFAISGLRDPAGEGEKKPDRTVKYRGPQGEVWTGVGAMAGWLKKLKDAGEDIERFRVQP